MKPSAAPKFRSEAEEAKWWDAHIPELQKSLTEAIGKGTAHRGGPKSVIQERRESKNITIRIAVSDIQRARALATKKGIGYQTVMKMLLKEGLDRELPQSSKKKAR